MQQKAQKTFTIRLKAEQSSHKVITAHDHLNSVSGSLAGPHSFCFWGAVKRRFGYARTSVTDNAVAPSERFVRETGLAASLAELVEPVLEDLGFRLVRAKKRLDPPMGEIEPLNS